MRLRDVVGPCSAFRARLDDCGRRVFLHELVSCLPRTVSPGVAGALRRAAHDIAVTPSSDRFIPLRLEQHERKFLRLLDGEQGGSSYHMFVGICVAAVASGVAAVAYQPSCLVRWKTFPIGFSTHNQEGRPLRDSPQPAECGSDGCCGFLSGVAVVLAVVVGVLLSARE